MKISGRSQKTDKLIDWLEKHNGWDDCYGHEYNPYKLPDSYDDKSESNPSILQLNDKLKAVSSAETEDGTFPAVKKKSHDTLVSSCIFCKKENSSDYQNNLRHHRHQTRKRIPKQHNETDAMGDNNMSPKELRKLAKLQALCKANTKQILKNINCCPGYWTCRKNMIKPNSRARRRNEMRKKYRVPSIFDNYGRYNYAKPAASSMSKPYFRHCRSVYTAITNMYDSDFWKNAFELALVGLGATFLWYVKGDD